MIEHSTMHEYDKKSLFEKLLTTNINEVDATKFEIEKYKIDKMVESGLIKEQSQETISRNKLIEYGYKLLKDNRFWYFLAFITIMFNSHNFWNYMVLKLNKLHP